MCPWLLCSFLQMTNLLPKHILKSRNYGLEQNTIWPTNFSAPLKERAVGNIVITGREHLAVRCWQHIKKNKQEKYSSNHSVSQIKPQALSSGLSPGGKQVYSPSKEEMCWYVHGQLYAHVWLWGVCTYIRTCESVCARAFGKHTYI